MFQDSTEHPRLRHVQAVAPVMVGLHFTSVRRKKDLMPGHLVASGNQFPDFTSVRKKDPNANGPAILCSQLAFRKTKTGFIPVGHS